MSEPMWVLFTKRWAPLPPEPLGEVVAGLGFDGIELPVRPGSWVSPEDAAERLPAMVEGLRRAGVAVASIAAEPTPAVLAACGDAGVDLIRVMVAVDPADPLGSVARQRDAWVALESDCERFGVRIGVQQHRGAYVATTLGVMGLLAEAPKHLVMVWDACHDALTGADPAVSLDLAAPRLAMANLKNAAFRDVSATAGARPQEIWYAPGRHGVTDWARVLGLLAERGWDGPICLTAELSDAATPDEVADVMRGDLAWAKELWSAAR
ncbi:sugar phosphate isomerase/epimerase [Propioniciclava coleopterorum]|uniref:Sugar phosphate isomerase/epimerase n=1 Tax=Propioniciclava coleopterorum TaxID=2714937 RepID=A0A6G7YAA5_9ACTN|nr:sugar phosphate isomerase/epimerase [Propioniciclava coleopterorum]QIK73700.1 sugar phosphate isomerase/epimerase [Propioniciclava coleopterorum]